MRSAFFGEIEKIYKRRNDIFVLTADLGYKLFDAIKNASPERFCNIGVAEQNMVGVAAGLALSGKNVYCYTIIPFLVMRAYEQIRVDVDYHNLDVKLVGAGAGFSYGFEGITHLGLEDLGMMRALQNTSVVVPADPLEAACAAKASVNYKGPLYIRLGQTGAPSVHEGPPAFDIGKAMVIKEGKGLAIFCNGSMVYASKLAADMLSKKGISPTIVNMHTLKPLDTDTIGSIAETHGNIFTVEEHNVNGGLGSAIAEVLLEKGYKGRFKRIGIPPKLGYEVGNADHLRQAYGLTPESIFKKISESF
ncbi:MAG: hypothetical protein JW919_02085 [Candidatus Omnitrophica bacterium]|nr:hypothetical protein [Candidatus Omnitrophota bacterium]